MNPCKCGCGAQVPRTYAQGHDAKHVSQLLAARHTPEEAAHELSAPLLDKFTAAHQKRTTK
ncbi:hypothetical protein HYQ03_gp26 [Arthrobacter phage Kuleana]|uniref:Uncharacterized protein n=1 Tax=Arthrobacter phage Kuleana TaxID=2653270 RepID=A0A5Q2WB27_9CAUD|nr:hypothetical protein HYQ03_gp26 [Arthrobacter phage Kuleana]QGH74513.1 hypothetical protein SEA_KULEANA_26 [Arthrobacter phage Kuleana]